MVSMIVFLTWSQNCAILHYQWYYWVRIKTREITRTRPVAVYRPMATSHISHARYYEWSLTLYLSNRKHTPSTLSIETQEERHPHHRRQHALRCHHTPLHWFLSIKCDQIIARLRWRYHHSWPTIKLCKGTKFHMIFLDDLSKTRCLEGHILCSSALRLVVVSWRHKALVPKPSNQWRRKVPADLHQRVPNYQCSTRATQHKPTFSHPMQI